MGLTKEHIQQLINDPAKLANIRSRLSMTDQLALDRLLQDVPKIEKRGLMEFIPSLSRTFTPPKHLAPMIDLLEQSWISPIRATICAPPRMAKTSVILAYIVLTLLKYPERTLAYVTYADSLSESKSRLARIWAEQAGVKIGNIDKMSEWTTKQGGGVVSLGVGGGLTGRGISHLVCDDPYKNRVDAESIAYRSRVEDWWNDVAETRIEPGGSAIVTHTRWHEQDLIGYLSKRPEWESLVLPAISDDNQALWPERFDLTALKAKKAAVGEYTWASLYQGAPRPRSGQLFQGINTYTKLPDKYSTAIGIDLAYSASSASDYSVAVVMMESEGYWYVVNVIRQQVDAPTFAQTLKTLHAKYPGAPMRWYAAGTEKGAADWLKKEGIGIQVKNTNGDKFIRAQPLSAAWNRGKVLLPASAPWLNDVVEEISSFTGINDTNDDTIDAAAACFDLLPETYTVPAHKVNSPEWYKEQEEELMAAQVRKLLNEKENDINNPQNWGYDSTGW